MAAAKPATTTPPANTTTTTISGFEHVRTISEALQHRAQHTPDKAAFIFRHPNSSNNDNDNDLSHVKGPDRRQVLTYGDLYQLGGRWSRTGLHSRGIGRGHLVVILLPNCPERAVVDSAVLLSGATCVNGFCQLKDASDLKTLLRRSAAVALVLDPDFMPDVHAALLQDLIQPPGDRDGGSVRSPSLPDLKYLLLVRRGEKGSPEDFLSSLRQAETVEIFQEKNVTEDDACMVFSTSGSSGFPKLVVFTHKSLVALVKSIQRPPNSVEFSLSLMGWVSGYFGNVVLSGTTRVLCDARAGLPEDFPAFIYRSVTEEGVTSGSVPLHLLQDLAEKVKEWNHGQPIFGMMGLGAQPITRQIVLEASKVARMMVAGYAGTEMMFVAAAVPVNVETYQDYFVGNVVPRVEVKVCDDQERPVNAGTRGEILVKTPYFFKEYLNDPEATAAAFTEDGFFRTGDVGWLDSEGKLYAEGRTKDAIMRGRVVVYPGGLESRILKCPAVRDVMVVGVPDVMLTNELCACVVLESGKWSVEDVQRYVEENTRGDYTDSLSTTPRYYLPFDSLPLTATGKPHRMQAKKMAEERILANQKPS